MQMHRMISKLLAVAVLALLGGSSSQVARAEVTMGHVVTIHAQEEVAASPADVWARVTTGKNMVSWCPYWSEEAMKKAKLGKVGDMIEFTDAWGNTGTSVVTHWMAGKELRVAHEPADGSYLCQSKLVLTPKGEGTQIDYWESYTDESSEKDRQATAEKMEKEVMKAVASIKMLADKK